MKKMFYLATILGVVFFTSCGGAETKDAADDDQAFEQAVKVPTLTINEANWVEKNLSAISNLTPVTVKVPKDAVLEKNGNGGVDIKFGEFYTISVYNSAISKPEEGISSSKKLSVESDHYQNAKVLLDEPNGFVYTYQMKDEANGHKYNPESHFFYYLEKDGAFYSFQDQKDFNVPEQTYTAAMAQQVYGIIKSSAKVNP